MNVLLISRINTDNLGDRAINMSMKKLVSKFNCNIYSADLRSPNKSKDLRLEKIEAKVINKSKLYQYLKNTKIYNYIWAKRNKKIYQILDERKYDLVLIGGGELVASSFQFCFSIYNWIRLIKKKNNKAKVYLFSVGVNNNLNKNDIYYIKKSLKYINDIYVRDEKSKNNFYNYFNCEPKLTYDCVFSNELQKYNEEERSIALYGITDYSRISRHNKVFNNKEEYFDSAYKDLKKIQSEYADKRIELYYTTQSDITECYHFNEYIENKYNEKFELSNYKNLQELLNKLKSTYYCASPRMHGCILARIMGVKNINPIIISNKMKSYSEKYGNTTDYNKIRNSIYESIEKIISGIGD